MLLLVGLSAICVGFVAWGVIRLIMRRKERSFERGSRAGEACAISIATFLLLLNCVIHIGVYSSNLSMIGRLEAVQEATITNYEVTADRSIELLSDKDVKAALLAGSVEKLSLGTDVVARLVDYRDTTVWHNKELAKLRAQAANPWTSIAVPEIPEDLGFITMDRAE